MHQAVRNIIHFEVVPLCAAYGRKRYEQEAHNYVSNHTDFEVLKKFWDKIQNEIGYLKQGIWLYHEF